MGQPELSLLEATWAELLAAGRDASPAGVSALLLADQIDRGGEKGAQLAALAKQHLATLDAALKDAVRAGDGIDELRQRRAKRVGLSA